MKKLIIPLFLCLFIVGCSNQQRGERSVKSFIQKFSTNPKTYEPVDFLKIESVQPSESDTHNVGLYKYKISHMYRIVGQDGINRRIIHEFKLSENFNVIVAPFEDWEK